MNIKFHLAKQSEMKIALDLLRCAALSLKSKKIDQWSFWLNPTTDKIEWIQEGFERKEFYFITDSEQLLGMIRLQDADLLYWGKRDDQAKYIHSLVIKEEFAGNQIGKRVIEQIIQDTINQGVFILRLDCNASNDKLCKYYENLGFVKVGQKQMPHSLNNLYQKELIRELYHES